MTKDEKARLKKFLKPKDLFELEQVESEDFKNKITPSGSFASIAREFHHRLGTDENYCKFIGNFNRDDITINND